METAAIPLKKETPHQTDKFRLPSLLNFWINLPESVRHLLLIGTTGKNHLTRIAVETFNLCNKTQQPKRLGFLVELISQLLLAAWEEDPLDVDTANQLWQWHCAYPFLDAHLASLVGAVCKQGLEAKDSSENSSSLNKDHPVNIHLEEPFNLTLLEYRTAYWNKVSEGNYDDAIRLLQGTCWPMALDGLRHRYLASLYQVTCDYNRWEEALYTKGALLSDFDRFLQLGNLAYAKGQRSRALEMWCKCLAIRPWFTNLILRIYDVATGLDRLNMPLKGRIAICLYTYNKASELQECLTSLAKSKLGTANIVLLINGCTDNTREIARHWQNHLGPARLRIIDLPINIGAPAARNWLMHDPQVKEADWVAYLDDDAIVPAHWLGALGSAVKRYPNAGVWGLRVIDAKVPSTIQAVDYHILPPPYGNDPQNSPPFKLATLHYETIDLGQFNYLRPCIHVTGCCHLFSTKTLLESGDFDLRFSPSQNDDLEHDFRLAFSGKPAVYQGHLSVKHMNQTAKGIRVNMKERGNAQANLYKLYHKYTPEEYLELFRRNMALIEQDFFQKLEEVVGYGPA